MVDPPLPRSCSTATIMLGWRRLLRLHERAIDRVVELLAMGMNLDRKQVTEIVACASLPSL